MLTCLHPAQAEGTLNRLGLHTASPSPPQDGDTILTYAYSSVVAATLLAAHKVGSNSSSSSNCSHTVLPCQSSCSSCA